MQVMPGGYEYVFVLWGDNFEEATAVIFVTELRRTGRLVKLVGLHPPPINGARGVALVPDLMLDQAPRLGEFFCRAHSNKAKFVIGPPNETNVADLELIPDPQNVITYADSDGLNEFVRELARYLPSAI
jgi:hypothetical protein